MQRAPMTTAQPASAAWRDELRATLALAWPLILSNLTMALIQATDVVLMGWLGPHQLAAAALGINLTFACLLRARHAYRSRADDGDRARARGRNAVRDVRRTFRQAMWLSRDR